MELDVRGLTGQPCSGSFKYGDLALQVGGVSDETLIYNYGSFATLTSELCALQNTDLSYRQRGYSI
jgi:hypothetical protein